MKAKVLLITAALLGAQFTMSATETDSESTVTTTQKRKTPAKKAPAGRTTYHPTSNQKGKYTTYQSQRNFVIDNPNFDSDEPVSDYNPRTIEAEVVAKVEWPESIPGVNDLSSVRQYIICEILGQEEGTDIQAALDAWTNDYVFDEDMIGGMFPVSAGLAVKPENHCTNFVAFSYDQWNDVGSGTGAGILDSENTFFLDKRNNGVLTSAEVFKDPYSPQLLRLINTYVKTAKGTYGLADENPGVYLPGATSLTFIFPKYTIAPGAYGNMRISIPYSKLTQYFLPEFSNMIK